MKKLFLIVLLANMVVVVSSCIMECSHYHENIQDRPASVQNFPYKGHTIMSNHALDGHVVILGRGGYLWRDGSLRTYPQTRYGYCLKEGHYLSIVDAMDHIDIVRGEFR